MQQHIMHLLFYTVDLLELSQPVQIKAYMNIFSKLFLLLWLWITHKKNYLSEEIEFMDWWFGDFVTLCIHFMIHYHQLEDPWL